MITLTHLSYTYPNRSSPVWQNLQLELPLGDFTLLVGASGAGKSTLLRCLNGLVPHFSGGELRGQVMVNGLNPVLVAPQGMSHMVGFVFQDPEAQFVMERVEDELAFALENAAMSPQEMRLRVEEVLDLLDLAPLRHRRLETLSGGEKQRVAIAAVMALRPQILLLDEPTSQLDPQSAEEVLQALVRLNHDLGLTVILAEHRLERVLPFADQMIYLPLNAPPLVGAPREVLPHIPLKPPLISLAERLQWQPMPLTIKEGRRFAQQFLAARPAISPPSPRPQPSGETLLQAEGVRVSYNEATALQTVSFSLQAGEIVALMGRNGAGKSTLLKTLVGLIRPQRGQVKLYQQDIAALDVATICRQVGYLPQDPNTLLFAETVLEEVQLTLKNHAMSLHDPLPLLQQLGLADKVGQYPRDLSVGERQRVALAAIMITRPRILLLDEPTRGLDYAAKHALLTLLRQWRAEGLAVLLITHDVELAASVADRVLLLSQGELIAQGSPQEVLAPSPLFAPQIARLFPQTGWLTVDEVR